MVEEKTKNKKKIRLVVIISIVVVLAVIASIYFIQIRSNDTGNSVSVLSVAEIMGHNTVVAENRYMGIVESQETKDISVDQNRKIDELFVEVGDIVKPGDKLFSYTTDDIERKMMQVNLEIEGMKNSINNSRTEIKALEAERLLADPEYQIDYTLQIQSLYASISQTEYSIRIKNVEYDQLKKSFDNSVVKAPIEGTIQSINETDSNDPYTGKQLPYIVIMKGGDFLVKGTVSELNIYSIYEGMRVLLRSRVDETKTWEGTIASIDVSKPQEDSSSMYYYGGPSDGGATKYSFYVEIDSIVGLMIGQHLTIEMKNENDTTLDDNKVWLYSYYIVDVETDAYVYADNGKGRIERRKVLLGSYDEEFDRYEILSGLSFTDYIAYPDFNISVGQRTVKDMEQSYSSEVFSKDEPINFPVTVPIEAGK